MDIEFGSKAVQYVRLLPKYLEGNGKALEVQLVLPALNIKDFIQIPPVDFNDKLRLASSWFGMCGISAQLSPVPGGGGIQLLQADGFDLHSFHTLTGVTFMMVAEPNTTESSEILRTTVYDLFCDYVQKNPFHETDQVIKSELFDTNLVAAVTLLNRRWAAMQN